MALTTAPFTYPSGLLPTRALDDALFAAYLANGSVTLSSAQVLAVTGPAPVFPSTLPLNAQDDENQAAYGLDLQFAL